MELHDLIFLLRLASAGLLLLFLGLLGRLLWVDLRQALQPALGAAAQEARLLVVAGGIAAGSRPAPGTIFALRPVTTIGRGSHCTIVVDDSYASNQHAMVTFRGNHWLLEDSGSSNGTLLNDLDIADPVVLSAGDQIRIGDTVLQFESDGPAEANNRPVAPI